MHELSFQERLEVARSYVPPRYYKSEVNCCGTALFLRGLAPTDSLVTPPVMTMKLEVDDFDRIFHPLKGCFVVYTYPERSRVVHVALALDRAGNVCDREETDKGFREDLIISDLDREYPTSERWFYMHTSDVDF